MNKIPEHFCGYQLLDEIGNAITFIEDDLDISGEFVIAPYSFQDLEAARAKVYFLLKIGMYTEITIVNAFDREFIEAYVVDQWKSN